MARGVERVSHGGMIGAARSYIRTFAHLTPNARRLLVANTCVNVGVGLFGVLFNLYLVAIGYGLAFVGLIAAVNTVGQAAVAPVVVWGLHRSGPRAVMMAGAGAMALGLALSAVTANAAALVIGSALSGAGLAIATIPAAPYMMEHSSSAERSHLFSAYFASNTVGSMIGSLLSGAVPAAAALLLAHQRAVVPADRAGLLVGAAITAAGVWSFWRMGDEAPTHDSADRPALPIEEGAGSESRLRRDVLVMLAATALIALTMGAIMPFFNVYFAQRLHASTGTIGTIYALSGVVCTVAAFATPALGRWGRLQGFSAARTFTAPVFLLFALHPGTAVAAVAYISRNSLGTISGALENTFAMEILPARLRGTVASWRSFAFNGGWTMGSLIAGIVVSRFGYDVIFIVGGLLTIAGSVAYYARFQAAR